MGKKQLSAMLSRITRTLRGEFNLGPVYVYININIYLYVKVHVYVNVNVGRGQTL